MFDKIELIMLVVFGLLALFSYFLYKKRAESPEVQKKIRDNIDARAKAYRDDISKEAEIRKLIEESVEEYAGDYDDEEDEKEAVNSPLEQPQDVPEEPKKDDLTYDPDTFFYNDDDEEEKD